MEHIKDIQKGKIKFSVYSVVDESPDLSFFGEYTDSEPNSYFFDRRDGILYGELEELTHTNEDGEEEYTEEHKVLVTGLPTQWDWRSYRYFVPANHLPHNPKNWEVCKPETLEKVVAEYGSLEAADIHYACDDYKRIEDYNRGGWYMIGIIVKMLLNGEEITDHSLWGIESDYEEDFFNEVVDDLIDSCITDAKGKVKSYRQIARELAKLSAE